MEHSEELNELAKALSIVQSKLEGARQDSTNPFYKSSYADLSSVWNACRKPLTDNGLSVVQTCDDTEEKLVVETVLLHSSGQWISGRLQLNPVKNDPQGIGSAITYARRYMLAAMVGISPEDDDAEAASGHTTKRTLGVNIKVPLEKDALAEEATRLKEELKGGIKNKGEFYERAFKEFKYSKTDTLKHLGVSEADLTDLDGAWKFLVEMSNKDKK